MSTKATIIYDEKSGVHIYEELLDGYIHLEIERDDIGIDLKLMPIEDWKACWSLRLIQ